jgi:hypothetical protein
MNSINTYLLFALGLVSLFALNKLHIITHKDILDKKAATNTIYINIKSE